MPSLDYFQILRGAFEQTERDIACACGATVRWMGTQFDCPQCPSCQRTPTAIVNNLRVILNAQLCAVDRLRDLIDRNDQLRHGHQLEHERRVADHLHEMEKAKDDVFLMQHVHKERLDEIEKALKAYAYRPRKRRKARKGKAKKKKTARRH